MLADVVRIPVVAGGVRRRVRQVAGRSHEGAIAPYDDVAGESPRCRPDVARGQGSGPRSRYPTGTAPSVPDAPKLPLPPAICRTRASTAATRPAAVSTPST